MKKPFGATHAVMCDENVVAWAQVWPEERKIIGLWSFQQNAWIRVLKDQYVNHIMIEIN